MYNYTYNTKIIALQSKDKSNLNYFAQKYTIKIVFFLGVYKFNINLPIINYFNKNINLNCCKVTIEY